MERTSNFATQLIALQNCTPPHAQGLKIVLKFSTMKGSLKYTYCKLCSTPWLGSANSTFKAVRKSGHLAVQQLEGNLYPTPCPGSANCTCENSTVARFLDKLWVMGHSGSRKKMCDGGFQELPWKQGIQCNQLCKCNTF